MFSFNLQGFSSVILSIQTLNLDDFHLWTKYRHLLPCNEPLGEYLMFSKDWREKDCNLMFRCIASIVFSFVKKKQYQKKVKLDGWMDSHYSVILLVLFLPFAQLGISYLRWQRQNLLMGLVVCGNCWTDRYLGCSIDSLY